VPLEFLLQLYHTFLQFDLNEIFAVLVSAVAMTIFIEMPISNVKKNFLGSSDKKAKEAMLMNGKKHEEVKN
jgi:hypothetical protein